jgi:hypothetical protein
MVIGENAVEDAQRFIVRKRIILVTQEMLN